MDEEEIHLDPDVRAGAWANWIRVVEREGEFTLDFGVTDPVDEDYVTVVARLALSDRALLTLKDEVDRAWAEYASGELPEGFRDE